MPSRHGNSPATVKAALGALDGGAMRLVAQSRLYRTPFIPKDTGADVINAVALIETSLSPQATLSRLHAIEDDFERARAARWGERTLDLDLLTFANRVLPNRATLTEWMDLPFEAQKQHTPGELIVPHPRLQDRAFVLVPAAEIAPDWPHPITGKTIAQMCAALPAAARDEIAVFEPHAIEGKG